MSENSQIQLELDATKLDVERLNDLLDKVQSDKRLLSEKVQSLSAKGKYWADISLVCIGTTTCVGFFRLQ